MGSQSLMEPISQYKGFSSIASKMFTNEKPPLTHANDSQTNVTPDAQLTRIEHANRTMFSDFPDK